MRKQQQKTSLQAPNFLTNSSRGRREVSMVIEVNTEVLDGGAGLVSDPGGPSPAGLFR